MHTAPTAAVLKRLKKAAGSGFRAFAGTLLFLGALQQSGATTVPYKSFSDLVRESDAVVSGRVAGIESKLSDDKEDIYTFVTLDNLETLSGSYSAPSVTLRFLGGQAGNDILKVSGSPAFTQNERVFVFVQGNGRNIVPVVGWTQGVFRIRSDSATGQQVISDHDGNRLFGLQNGTIVKENVYQPESMIVYPQGVKPGLSPDSPGSAGIPDYIAPAERGIAPGVGRERPIAAQPPMTPAAFATAVRQAAQMGRGAGTLQSVRPEDTAFPADRKDAGTGPATNSPRPGQSPAPVLPKPLTPEPSAVDRQ